MLLDYNDNDDSDDKTTKKLIVSKCLYFKSKEVCGIK